MSIAREIEGKKKMSEEVKQKDKAKGQDNSIEQHGKFEVGDPQTTLLSHNIGFNGMVQ